MKSLTKIGLGILTSVGGYLEVGSIGTAIQAGAAFRFSLLWTIALGTICIAFLTEMTGRLAAVSHEPVVAAVRKRFGIRVHLWPLTTQVVIDLLVLGYSALYLIEAKSGPGRYEGDSLDWYRTAPGDDSALYLENPFRLTNHKAKILASRLRAKMRNGKDAPFIQPLVFLSAPEEWVSFEPPRFESGLPRQVVTLRLPRDQQRDFVVAATTLPDISAMQVGRITNSREMILQPFRRVFISVAAPTILLGVIVGALFAWRALRPVREIAATAESILNTGDLNQVRIA